MENQEEYSNGRFRLERANFTYFMEDPEEIGRLGISEEKYDGSPVHYVQIGKNAGEFIIHLLNPDRIGHFDKKPRKPACNWDIQKKENQEKIIRHLKLEFLL
jgi:hypothetical protein